MKATMTCPVCGADNERVYYDDSSLGTVEDFYHCDQCGYFYEMSYSPYHDGIDAGIGKVFFRRFFARIFSPNQKWRKLGLKYSRCHF